MARTEPGFALKLILASGSPRRSELLSLICKDFEVLPADADEARREGESPEDLAGRLAFEKASIVAARRPDAVVLGCDTVVALGGEVFGKPLALERELCCLRALIGRAHDVYTGLAAYAPAPQGRWIRLVVRTKVEFGSFPERVLEDYAKTGEGFDKAGGYAIQGRGAFLVRSICGSYTSVVGLPLCEAAQVLGSCGIEVFGK